MLTFQEPRVILTHPYRNIVMPDNATKEAPRNFQEIHNIIMIKVLFRLFLQNMPHFSQNHGEIGKNVHSTA